MALRDVAEEYFGKMNSIAKRMYADMNETRAAYEDFWYALSEAKRNQILDESIVKPEICTRYHGTTTTGDAHVKNEFAVKLVVEDNYTYRDEHSAPFSVRTPSQRNLSMFESSGEKGKGKSKSGREHARVGVNKAGARHGEKSDAGTPSRNGERNGVGSSSVEKAVSWVSLQIYRFPQSIRVSARSI